MMPQRNVGEMASSEGVGGTRGMSPNLDYRHQRRRAWAWMGLVAAGVMAGPLFPGCQELLTFDVVKTAQTTVPGSDLLGDLLTVSFPEFATFDVTSTDEFQNQGITAEDIESVKIDTIVLRVVSPDEQDLAFFDAISFYVEAEGLERTRLATHTTFEEGVREVTIMPDDVELRDYVVSDTMAITTDVTARQPPEDTVLEAKISMTLVASRQGFCRALDEVF